VVSSGRSFQRRIRERLGGIDIAADINAEVAVNTGRAGQTTVARSAQNSAISQTTKRVGDDSVTNDKEHR
jgi:hypothetical protein